MKLLTTLTIVATSSFAFSDTYVVEAHTMTFVPDVVTVSPGDVIRWEYVTGYPHDVTSGTKCSHDGYLYLDIPSGGSVEWTVPEDAPSEIPYFCELHCGNGMTGMINVEGDSDECPSDVNHDGLVNVTDLLAAIGDWGMTDSPADVNGDGIVNVSDLLAMIDAWGACP